MDDELVNHGSEVTGEIRNEFKSLKTKHLFLYERDTPECSQYVTMYRMGIIHA